MCVCHDVIELPEKVDIIISEPMGFMLVHERMLEVLKHIIVYPFLREYHQAMFISHYCNL